MAPLLKLPRQAASEEARILAFQCVASALGGCQVPNPVTRGGQDLQPSASGHFNTVSATTGSGFPGEEEQVAAISRAFGSGTAAAVPPVLMAGPPSLSSLETAPLVGFLVHSCLEVSEQELQAAGLTGGSKDLRTAALRCLRCLLCRVGDADALAFFLPGVASSLAKQMVAAASECLLRVWVQACGA